jgi:hypothetical protein
VTKVTRQWEVPTGKVLSMKTLTLIALMMPTMAFAGSNSDAQLAQKLQSQRNFDGGVSVRAVDKKYVDAAVAKLGGRATIEFGSKDQVSMGGVIVGSGADGLVSRSNSQAGAPVVIAPPVVPKTSITVAGRVPTNMPDTYCATPLKLGVNGEVLQNQLFSQRLWGEAYHQASLRFDGVEAKCVAVGTPLRLAPGKFVVTYNNTFYVVDLKSQENKVIPLREVRVTKFDGNISFRLYRDFTSSQEVNKALLLIKSDASLGSPQDVQTVARPAVLEAALSKVIPGHLDWEKFPMAVRRAQNSFYLISAIEKLLYTVDATDGGMIPVLPGQYNIQWDIDGQHDYTTGIRVD